MIHSSPSSTAAVLSEAKSDPELGSLNPWHQRVVPFMMLGKNSFFCSSVPHCNNVGPTKVSPKKSARNGAFTAANSSDSTTPCIVVSPLPPYSLGQVAQIQPPANNFDGHSSTNFLRASPVNSNPGVPQPAGRLATNHSRISPRKASASAG
ncbi:unannotated protein [freshwater metagenome]|uniref:Unannotated protein n=1 Tax=freshwater metagenome TaxID=449393 RepID=A0A6J7S4U2_9ZZZZ